MSESTTNSLVISAIVGTIKDGTPTAAIGLTTIEYVSIHHDQQYRTHNRKTEADLMTALSLTQVSTKPSPTSYPNPSPALPTKSAT